MTSSNYWRSYKEESYFTEYNGIKICYSCTATWSEIGSVVSNQSVGITTLAKAPHTLVIIVMKAADRTKEKNLKGDLSSRALLKDLRYISSGSLASSDLLHSLLWAKISCQINCDSQRKREKERVRVCAREREGESEEGTESVKWVLKRGGLLVSACEQKNKPILSF